MNRRYVLISPTRNERSHARVTVESVLAQTVPPDLWVIVDDGSSDGTTELLQEYAKRHNFIRLIQRQDRGRRSVGPGVVDTFYTGLATVHLDQYDYIGKLDLDLDLPAFYFQRLIERMETMPRLGSCSGKPFVRLSGNDRLIPEKCGHEMSVGMSKFYRTRCFRQIGGFVRQVMWDGIDCHLSRMYGWQVRSWDDDPDLCFEHLRPMGSSDAGALRGRMRHGVGQYYMGTGPLYITVSAICRLTERPRLLGSAAMWGGYVRSWLRGDSRLPDARLRAFVRRYQRLALLFGKQRAVQRLEAEHTSKKSERLHPLPRRGMARQPAG